MSNLDYFESNPLFSVHYEPEYSLSELKRFEQKYNKSTADFLTDPSGVSDIDITQWRFNWLIFCLSSKEGI